jgi:Uma2 family endonuclease
VRQALFPLDSVEVTVMAKDGTGGTDVSVPQVAEPEKDIYDTYDELPEGLRAEIIEGNIVVSPMPRSLHMRIVNMLTRDFLAACPEDWYASQNATIDLLEDGERVRYIPDLAVGPDDRLTYRGYLAPASAFELVVEVTSRTTARRDREVKLRTFATGGIPYYLLVDPLDRPGMTTLYSKPSPEGRYWRDVRVPFGEKLHIPAPFDLEIDTSRFPTES